MTSIQEPTQAPRIAGWLLAPLAWLLMTLLSSTIAVSYTHLTLPTIYSV